MELKLVPKLSQSLVMTPQLKMAIKLLTLNHLELKDAVAQELIDNPVLEEMADDAPRATGAEGEGIVEKSKSNDEKPVEVTLGADGGVEKAPEQSIDWESYAESYNYLPPSAGSGRDTQFDDLPGIDQTLTRSETLEEHILWQVRMSDMSELEKTIAVRLLGEMNDDGFLDSNPIRHAEPVKPVELKPAEAASAASLASFEQKTGTNHSFGRHDTSSIPESRGADAARNAIASASASASANHGNHGNHANHANAVAVDDDDDHDEEEELLADGPAREQRALEAMALDLDDEEPVEEPALLADGPDKDARVDPLELVSNDLEVPIEWVDAVRKRVMQMDPVGVLARDLGECLLAQLDVWGYDNECLVWQIVSNHMKDVEKHNFTAIARNCKCLLEDVGEAMKIIEQLEPRPARNFILQGTMPDSQYITPDVYVYRLGEELIISLNEDGLPKLKMSRFYLDKIREAQALRATGVRVPADPSRSYIKDKMRSATC